MLIAGGIVMSVFVVVVNRLFWRRLYRLAETQVHAVTVARTLTTAVPARQGCRP